MKTQLTAVEYASLDTKTRAKYRKLMKEYEATLNPVRSAKIRLEHELRIQAYKDLNISERVKVAKQPIREQLTEVEAQLRVLNDKWRELSDQLSQVANDIETEPYSLAYEDPQVKALSAIWSNINETHAKKLETLIESTQEVNA
jgi:hypothetical protein